MKKLLYLKERENIAIGRFGMDSEFYRQYMIKRSKISYIQSTFDKLTELNVFFTSWGIPKYREEISESNPPTVSVLKRCNLSTVNKNKSFNDIDMLDFSDYKKRCSEDIVIFVDDDGAVKVIKDRGIHEYTSRDLINFINEAEADVTLPLLQRIYQHYKGGLYEVITCAEDINTHETTVIYKSYQLGTVYSRPLKEWNELISIPGKDVNVKRFELIKLKYNEK